MTAFGLYLGTSFDIKQLVKILGVGLGVGLIICWVIAVAVPSIGRDNEVFIGAWTGVYGHKNSASVLMILTAVTLLLMSTKKIKTEYLVDSRLSILTRILASLAIIFVLLTTSATGLVLLISIPLSLFLYTRFKWKGKTSILFFSLFSLILGLSLGTLFDNWQDIVVGLGKDPTLTGRVPMWNVAIDKIMDRPFLGYGKSGFWAPESPYRFQVGRAVALGFYPNHIHNGFIETALDIGLIGLLCFFASLLIVIWRSLKQAYFRSTPEDLFPLCFLIVFIVNNITESYILYQYHLLWPLYIAIAFNVGYSSITRDALFTNIINKQRMPEPLH
jgi:exopolysaccharide production protein ExoQ